LQVVFLLPNDTSCVDYFIVAGRDVASGAALPPRKVEDGLAATFGGLAPGATYLFDVSAAGRAAGAGPPLSVRAALPPGALDAAPGPPERFRAAAASDTAANLYWDLPAGNPTVDHYTINALETNSTGYPLPGATALNLTAPAAARTATVRGLKPGAYYGFVIQSATTKYGSSDPAFAFRPMPPAGMARPPGPPRALVAVPVGNASVVLSWCAMVWGLRAIGEKWDYRCVRAGMPDSDRLSAFASCSRRRPCI
jgi:hypothetical protein